VACVSSRIIEIRLSFLAGSSDGLSTNLLSNCLSRFFNSEFLTLNKLTDPFRVTFTASIIFYSGPSKRSPSAWRNYCNYLISTRCKFSFSLSQIAVAGISAPPVRAILKNHCRARNQFSAQRSPALRLLPAR
jgi:hypothetical protein